MLSFSVLSVLLGAVLIATVVHRRYMTRRDEERPDEYDPLRAFGRLPQALWYLASLLAAAITAILASHGELSALLYVIVTALCGYGVYANRKTCREIVAIRQQAAERMLQSYRARRRDVPVTENARLDRAPDGLLIVRYPAIWPPSPLRLAMDRLTGRRR